VQAKADAPQSDTAVSALRLTVEQISSSRVSAPVPGSPLNTFPETSGNVADVLNYAAVKDGTGWKFTPAGATPNILGSAAPFPIGTSDRTIALDFRVAASQYACLLFYGIPTAESQFQMIMYNTGRVDVAAYGDDIHDTASVTLNVWHRFVVTYSGGTAHIWFDGVDLGAHAGLAWDTKIAQQFYLAQNNEFGDGLTGYICNVRAWDRKLTDVELGLEGYGTGESPGVTPAVGLCFELAMA
jgi:hypothetical protein